MSSSFFPTGAGDRMALMKRQRSAESTNSNVSGSTSISTSRPRRMTMAGMIYDANRILGKVMDPNAEGLHPGLFDPDLLGIGFYTVWEAGLIFSGNIGTGIVLARNPMDPTSWSPPAAVGLSSVGAGLMGGVSMKHIVYLIYDYYTLKSMSGENGVKISSQAEASVFKFGRLAEVSAIATAKGIGSNIALGYDSLGIFGGISIEGGIMKGRKHMNERFYGKKDIKTVDILFSGECFDIPEETLLPELYLKLNKLCSGTSVHEPTPEERVKIKSTKKQVEEEEDNVAEEVSYYMAFEGDESVAENGSQTESRDRDVDTSNHSSRSRNRTCSTSSVPSVILEDETLDPNASALSTGLNSLAIMSDSDIVIFEDATNANGNKSATDRSHIEENMEKEASAYLQANT